MRPRILAQFMDLLFSLVRTLFADKADLALENLAYAELRICEVMWSERLCGAGRAAQAACPVLHAPTRQESELTTAHNALPPWGGRVVRLPTRC